MTATRRNVFRNTIRTKSIEERDRVIESKKLAGFQLVKTFEVRKEGTHWVNEGYNSRRNLDFKIDGGTDHIAYCAVMERDNTEYLKRKEQERLKELG